MPENLLKKKAASGIRFNHLQQPKNRYEKIALPFCSTAANDL